MNDAHDTQERHGRGFATRAIHEGYDPLEHEGALNPPVYLNSTFAFPTSRKVSGGSAASRAAMSTPVLATRPPLFWRPGLASLEGGEAGLATASGMGAITATLWTLIQAGDTIVADRTLYGCTFGYLQHGLTRLGVRVQFVDLTRPEELAAAMTLTPRWSSASLRPTRTCG